MTEASAEDHTEPIDLACVRDTRARALMASGLPPVYWYTFAMELEAIEAADVPITDKLVASLAARWVEQHGVKPEDKYKPIRQSSIEIQAEIQARSEAEQHRDCVVYYMRLGNRVKIGWTSNLQRRLETINPEELLATEPGGRIVESRRHKQFVDLRTHGEWFEYRAPLTTWIRALREPTRASA